MTDFVDKQTVIEADWLNSVDALVLDVFQSATSASLARSAIDVPQETAEIVPQVRVAGQWAPLTGAVGPLHQATHLIGGTDPIDHDGLLNGAGTKHTDHAAVSVAAGGGLSGGGDLTANRTIAFAYLLGQTLDGGSNRITNLLEPASNQDACTKLYADNLLITSGANPWTVGVTPNSIFYSTGFVGIGTDTPIYDLDVRGTSQITELALFGDNIEVSGNTGLGVITPTARLHVSGTSILGGTLQVTGISTLAATNATTLTSSGAATLNSLGVTNGATVGGTLGVTGNTTMNGAANVINGDLTIQ